MVANNLEMVRELNMVIDTVHLRLESSPSLNRQQIDLLLRFLFDQKVLSE